jgi:hypothetical protein
MIVFPVAAALVSLAFGVHLLARFLRRGAPHEGVWAVAMLMFAVASVAFALGLADGWTAGEFRLYWLLGAVLNVPYLAQGEVYLLTPRRWAHVVLVLLLVGTAWATVEIWTVPVREPVLSEEFPLGKDVFGDGSAPHRLAQYYGWTGYLLLLAGAVWSAGRMRGSEALRRRAAGTGLVAVGATIVAVGSGVGAAYGIAPLFSVALAAGAAVMYWGFLVAVRPAPSGSRL